jgi:hypothetical protein
LAHFHWIPGTAIPRIPLGVFHHRWMTEGGHMSMRRILILLPLGLLMTGCAYMSTVNFPDPNKVFMTTGDGNIQKPYTPVGELLYFEQGYRIPVPILALLPIHDVDPEVAIRQKLAARVIQMGGDGIINLKITWQPARTVYLVMGNPGSISVQGTVIKR